MIYDLQCSLGHKFEGWFPNSEAYDKQKEMHLLECSVCGIKMVDRLPTATHLIASRGEASVSGPQAAPVTVAEKTKVSSTVVNVDPVVVLKAVHHYIRSNFKDVGTEFSEKAAQMSRGETPFENIHGQASPSQCEKLEEEGVSFFVFPPLPDEFKN